MTNENSISKPKTQQGLMFQGRPVMSTLPNYHVTTTSEGYPLKYGLMDGTSMATPFVAALAALIWSKWPQLTSEQVRQKIISSASPVQGGWSQEYGNGIINAKRALT